MLFRIPKLESLPVHQCIESDQKVTVVENGPRVVSSWGGGGRGGVGGREEEVGKEGEGRDGFSHRFPGIGETDISV
jgi:hypothetical protein